MAVSFYAFSRFRMRWDFISISTVYCTRSLFAFCFSFVLRRWPRISALPSFGKHVISCYFALYLFRALGISCSFFAIFIRNANTFTHINKMEIGDFRSHTSEERFHVRFLGIEFMTTDDEPKRTKHTVKCDMTQDQMNARGRTNDGRRLSWDESNIQKHKMTLDKTAEAYSNDMEVNDIFCRWFFASSCASSSTSFLAYPWEQKTVSIFSISLSTTLLVTVIHFIISFKINEAHFHRKNYVFFSLLRSSHFRSSFAMANHKMISFSSSAVSFDKLFRDFVLVVFNNSRRKKTKKHLFTHSLTDSLIFAASVWNAFSAVFSAASDALFSEMTLFVLATIRYHFALLFNFDELCCLARTHKFWL